MMVILSLALSLTEVWRLAMDLALGVEVAVGEADISDVLSVDLTDR